MQGDVDQNRDVYGSGEGNKQGWSSVKHGAFPGHLLKFLPHVYINEFTSSK